MSDQPEALRLADILQHRFPSVECLEKAAAELRRLHAECDALRAMADDVQRWHDQQLDRADKAEAECDALRAELAAMTKRATDAEGYAEHLLTEARKTADVMAQAEAECDALRVPCRTLVSLLETDDWQATLRLAVEQARAALKEAK